MGSLPHLPSGTGNQLQALQGGNTITVIQEVSEVALPTGRRLAIDDRYVGARGKVLLHLGDNATAASFAGYGNGTVFHGRAGFEAARQANRDRTVAIDRELYVSDRRRKGALQLFPETPGEAVANQLHAGADWLLAQSRFPVDRSPASLARSLGEGADFISAASAAAPSNPAFVPVVVRYDELIDGRWLKPVAESGLPIAAIFAGWGDPLGTADQLAGAIELLRACEVAIVLRCDASVAGLMACGAIAGAVGTSSSVRHLFLPRKGSGVAARSLFVPVLGTWTKVKFVREALADPELHEIFACWCDVCGHDGDVRSLCQPGVSDTIQDRHSVAAAVSLVQGVIESSEPLESWRAVCDSADTAYARMSELGITGPTRPGALDAWLKILGAKP